MKSVTLSDNITGFGSSVFSNCTSLETINIPKKLKYFGEEMFSGCSAIKSVEIPENVSLLPDGIFRGCSSLSKVTFKGENLSTIGRYAFAGTIIKSIVLPNSLRACLIS